MHATKIDTSDDVDHTPHDDAENTYKAVIGLRGPGGGGLGSTDNSGDDPEFTFTPEELASINASYEIQQAQFAELLGIPIPDDMKVSVTAGDA